MKILLEHIKELVQVEDLPVQKKSGAEMAKVTTIKDAYLLVNNELIEDFGKMSELDDINLEDDHLIEIDCSGRLVYPSYCDSHTHLVYPQSREKEFVDKIRGLSYEEIARRGGGILNSAQKMNETDEEQLFYDAMERIDEIIQLGTGAVEIKSGYGLSIENEMKMLRVIRRIKENVPIIVRSSFLGAHAVPLEYRGNQSKYVDLVVNEMIPRVAEEKLADYIDVFCDKGFFTVEETERILEAGQQYGLRAKIHANELGNTGGIQAGVKYDALSVDHLEYVEEAEIETLLSSNTMPTVLPGAAFFLNLKLSPVREMIEAGLPVALASDFNPGSSPSGNMNFITALGCIKYRMLPEEVINATTINTAYAMDIVDRVGSIARGKIANLFITKEAPGIEYIPYMYGSNLIDTVILNGEIQEF